MKKIKVLQIGLGPLGIKMVQSGLDKSSIQFIGAVDPNPDIAGKDLGDYCGIKKMGITISPDLETALKKTKSPDAAIVTTVSDLLRLQKQISPLAKAKIPVVSTCEELSFPWRKNDKIARSIDKEFRDNGVACLGTGVNPGFLMDFLPSVFLSVARKVTSVRVNRFQDATTRRLPFQLKIGAGLNSKQFQAKVDAGTLRHVGLEESVRMIASGLGWTLENYEESLKSVKAKGDLTTPFLNITKGLAAGVEQFGIGTVNGVKAITLHFRATIGEPEPRDEIFIDGDPSFQTLIPGGIHGDVATIAITLNALKSILATTPGLKTMLDVPVPAFLP